MSSRERMNMRSIGLSVVLAGMCGLLGGLVSGWVIFLQSVRPEIQRLEQAIESLPATGTRPIVQPEPSVEIVPIEPRPLTPAYPAAFSERRSSSVIVLVRRRAASQEPVSPERELGAAVAITSDGWLATTDAAFSGLRLTDISAAVNGKVLPVLRGVRDRSTGIIYLKVDASGLPTPAFVRALDVVSGAPVWVESTPRQLAPEIVITSRARISLEAVPSERASRRFFISGESEGRRAGASVWDGAGRLIGLLESSADGGWRVIPAGPIGNGLSQLLSPSGEIRRATLGVRSLDLAGVTLDMPTSSLPTLGAWVRSVTARGVSARAFIEGDVIERIERDILDGTADLGERLFDYRPGATVGLSGRRKGTAFQVQVTLGSEIVSEILK